MKEQITRIIESLKEGWVVHGEGENGVREWWWTIAWEEGAFVYDEGYEVLDSGRPIQGENLRLGESEIVTLLERKLPEMSEVKPPRPPDPVSPAPEVAPEPPEPEPVALPPHLVSEPVVLSLKSLDVVSRGPQSGAPDISFSVRLDNRTNRALRKLAFKLLLIDRQRVLESIDFSLEQPVEPLGTRYIHGQHETGSATEQTLSRFDTRFEIVACEWEEDPSAARDPGPRADALSESLDIESPRRGLPTDLDPDRQRDHTHRMTAARVLGDLGSEASASALISALGDPHIRVREVAAASLRLLTERHPSLSLDALADTEGVPWKLGACNDHRAASALGAMWRGALKEREGLAKRDDLRRAAVEALAALGVDACVPHLKQAAQDPLADIAHTARRGLDKIQ